jgi:hypothetical protein
MMRRIALLTIAMALAAAPAAAATTKVQIMVVGKAQILVTPRTVSLQKRTVKIGRKRCGVPARTPLSGLLATHLSLRVSDVAGCDPASMFVKQVHGESNRGQAGWQYKIGHASPSFGAADPGGKLRSNQQLLWFWCTRANACQRTLAVKTQFSGSTAKFHVVGYDDNGHGRSVGGATVHVGSQSLTTNSHGWATTALAPGHYQVYATKAGLVRSFPTGVGVAT